MAGGGFFDRRWVKVAAVVFSAVVGLAGVGSLWLTWHERQRPPTSAGWTNAALAVCERHANEFRVPMRDAMTRMTSVYAAISSATAALQSARPSGITAALTTLSGVAEDMHDIAAALEDSGDALSAVVGDFRSLPAPPESQAGIDRLIATGKRLSGELSDIAGSTRSIAAALDQLDPRDLAASAPAIAQLAVEMPKITTALQGNQDTVADWNAELAALQIGSCEPATSGFVLPTPTTFPTTISPTVPPTPVPPSTSRTGFDAAQSALLDMLAGDMWWSYDSDDIYMIAEAPDPATLYSWWSDGSFLTRT
ncbi:MAG: hypothetical protein ACT4NY_11845 [Pseudonocardiales bacterium]